MVFSFTWALSSIVGVVAGMLIAALAVLDPAMMMDPLLKGFASGVLGGMTSLPGAAVGGAMLGIIENLFGGYISLWEASTATRAVIGAMRTTKSAEPAKIAEAMRGMPIPSPVGMKNGTITMRAQDKTIIDYALVWGRILPTDPYLTNIAVADWAQVLALETEWKKEKSYV